MEDGIVVWATVPTTLLAFDVVFGTGEPADDAVEAFRQLGSYLARLHSTPIPAALAELPYGHGRRVRPADPSLRATRHAARRWLASQIGAPSAPETEPVKPVLGHGRFSLGAIAWGPSPIVLGWRESGPGAAGTDVDTMLSELAEATAAVPNRAAWVTSLATAFVESYVGTAPADSISTADLDTRIRAHVLDHMALNVIVTGDREAPLAFLRLVQDRIGPFCASIAARLTTANGG
jgi:hypothetical protein